MSNYSSDPQVYITSLSDYNEGKLVGEWLDLTLYTDQEEVLEAIAAFLEGLDTADGVENYQKREEWFISDYEGFPERFYSEHMDFEEVLQWVEDTWDMDKDRKEAYEVFLDNEGGSTSLRGFEDKYKGEWDSWSDFAEDYMEQTGEINLIPKHLQPYFDYEYYGRNMSMSGDYWEDQGHYFSNY